MRDDGPIKMASCAPINIAVVKYWGKRDERLVLPCNSSISLTLDMDSLSTSTIVEASPKFEENEILLNGKKESFDNTRLKRCINDCIKFSSNPEKWARFKFHISSKNSFPTAAGLASSASGYACLVNCLCKMFGIREKNLISRIARMGSGSASRSILGGWAEWQKGEESDGSDSFATEIKPFGWWPDFRILILISDNSSKSVSSTIGMRRTANTSRHFAALLKTGHCEEQIEKMRKAISGRDFASFAEITMRESNRLHSACLDTFPPIFYLNDISRKVIETVHSFNSQRTKAAYSFDAGPNAFLFVLKDDLEDLINSLFGEFGQFDIEDNSKLRRSNLASAAVGRGESSRGIKRAVLARIGPGPKSSGDIGQSEQDDQSQKNEDHLRFHVQLERVRLEGGEEDEGEDGGRVVGVVFAPCFGFGAVLRHGVEDQPPDCSSVRVGFAFLAERGDGPSLSCVVSQEQEGHFVSFEGDCFREDNVDQVAYSFARVDFDLDAVHSAVEDLHFHEVPSVGIFWQEVDFGGALDPQKVAQSFPGRSSFCRFPRG
ncbi:hypothetical protein MHBO_000633, partial [Bonamia ostreae]